MDNKVFLVIKIEDIECKEWIIGRQNFKNKRENRGNNEISYKKGWIWCLQSLGIRLYYGNWNQGEFI